MVIRKILLVLFLFSFFLVSESLADNNIINNKVAVRGDTGYMLLCEMNYSSFYGKLLFLKSLGVKRIVIDLMTYGGSVFEALAIASEIESSHIPITIIARGLVASAGVIVLVSSKERYALKDTLFMFHEISIVKLLSIESVSDQEEQSKILKWIQDRILDFICSRTNLKVEELKLAIKKKEKWWDAKEALKDGLIVGIVNAE